MMNDSMKHTFLNGRVTVVVGDITEQKVDAVVNAANRTLLGGGGVDGAIHRAGGEEINQACLKIRQTDYPQGLPTGKAVITTGGQLSARFVIHTVGPIFGIDKENEANELADCYRNSLALAVAHGLTTIAFPAISTGAYSFPRHEAAAISSQAVKEFLENDDKITEVRFVFFSTGDTNVFLKHQRF
jgi:O-acetyl-ADP-ribose deacetylase (regulator of RNase III)